LLPGADNFAAEGFDSGLRCPYHARAMGDPLRDRRTAQDWAKRGQVIEIAEKIGGFTRLAGIVEKDLETLRPARLPHDWRDATVVGRLQFGFADAQRDVPALEGRVAVTVDAVCQRCLEPMRLPLETELRLLFDVGGSGIDAGDGYEVWELEDQRLRPLDVVEEALVMALPLAAMHADAECSAATADEREKATRPFANLRGQMDGGNNEC
jgi:uncharacterized protein